MRKFIGEGVRLKMLEMYKVEGKRAQEIADLYHCSIQHVLRIIRELEGKPVYKKGRTNVFASGRKSSAFKLKNYRNDYYEEAPLEERTNPYTHSAKRVDAGIYSDK